MAGNIGSPLCAELNRIANNGVYPDRDDFLEEQGAANVWAGTTGLGLLGALNYIVDPTRTDNNYKGLTAVCNELAGTTGLSDVDALRTINHAAEVLLRGTTPQSAAFYTDAATPRYNYPGYIRLDGAFTQSISTPDATALDITGDLDLRAYVAADDWTPSVRNILISKATGTQNSYEFNIETDGTLRFYWSTDGTTLIVKPSTAAVPFANGAAGWVRVTLDVNNGASGNDVKFFTSTDGTTWTQLGSTVTTAGVTSIFNSTSNVFLGTASNGVSNPLTGNVYRAQIFASLDGTDKRLDVDLTTNVTSATYDQFTATTGQLCTINGQNTLTNGGSAGSLLPVTVGSSLAADSNDAKFLAHDGTNYVYLPGSTSNSLEVPDSAALDVTGDIDIRVRVAMDDWTPGTTTNLISKAAASNISYRLQVDTSGTLAFGWSSDGTTLGSTRFSTVATGVADGAAKWVRVTVDVDNGASGNDTKFWLSDDGSTWTQLGTTVTNAGVISFFSGTAAIVIGLDLVQGRFLSGKIYRAQILNGIDGTKVLDVDTSVITTGAATSFTAVTGQTVTINRSTSGRKTVAVTQPTWLFGTDDYMEVNNRYMAHSGSNYLYLPGIASNFASAPDSAALSITGDIDIRCKVALDDWTPAALTALVSKSQSTVQRSYYLAIETTGRLSIYWSANGSTQLSSTSTAAPTVADGATLWVRVTLDVDNGASGNTATFFTSNDGITWTTLGTPVVTAGTTSIFDATSQLEIGAASGGAFQAARGKFFRAQVLNGINGTLAFDANFESSITSLNQASFTESSSNAATVTINRSGSAYRSAGVIDAGYLYPGATNTFANSTIDYLNFGASQDFTVLAVARQFGTTAGNGEIINKGPNYGGSTVNGYSLVVVGGTSQGFFVTAGAGVFYYSNVTSVSAGNIFSLSMARSGATVLTYNNTNAVGTQASVGTLSASLANVQALRIGSNSTPSQYFAGEVYAAAVFRSVLTPKNIADITNYFNGRD